MARTKATFKIKEILLQQKTVNIKKNKKTKEEKKKKKKTDG